MGDDNFLERPTRRIDYRLDGLVLLQLTKTRKSPRTDRSGRPFEPRSHLVPLALQFIHPVNERIDFFQHRWPRYIPSCKRGNVDGP